jgi:hypothetical protein
MSTDIRKRQKAEAKGKRLKAKGKKKAQRALGMQGVPPSSLFNLDLNPLLY